MRLDLFLKWSRIVLRRTLAKELCDADRVKVNGQPGRAGRELKVGDVVEIQLHRRFMKFRVRESPLHAPSKEKSRDLIEVLENVHSC